MHNLNIYAIAKLLGDERVWIAGKEAFKRAVVILRNDTPDAIDLICEALTDVGDSDEIVDAAWYASAVIAEYYYQENLDKKIEQDSKSLLGT